MATANLTLELHERQSVAFETRATEVLYGGAAGGGKSHLMRAAAIAWCVALPGLQVYLFRRTSPDLHKNHMEGPTSFPSMLADWVEAGFAKINHSKGYIEIGKSRIHLCHCQYEKDVYKYQGAEIHVLMMDELTHFSRPQYAFLRSRVRMAGIPIPAEYQGRFPRIVNGSNPGGVGHNWVKAMFVDAAAPMECWQTPRDEGGMLRQFIPARLEDNPTLLETDPDYEHRLEGLGNPALVRAMRTGDWDIVSGGMFDDVWSRDVHVLPAFPIPAGWWVDRSYDWGSSKPFSVGWWAEVGDPYALPDGRVLPKGSVIRIGEWYGWNGRPNEGLKLTDDEIALGIRDREKALGIAARVKPGPADNAIFNASPGHKSPAQAMAEKGVRFTESDKKAGSRKAGWARMRQMLRAAMQERPEDPGLYVFDSCRQFIRTVPVLPRSERDPDDVDTNAEDHIGDETRYRVTAPRRQLRSDPFKVV